MILTDKRIVITGGTGSLGKTLVHRILSGELGTPKKVIIFSRDEAKQHDMRISYLHKSVVTDEVIYRNFMNILEMRIGDVRDYANVCSVLKDADIVFNAASLKQVPTCEYFPVQALQTNCLGAYNIARAIEENSYPVETVVGISTDKACKPVNVMGMTKSIQERIFIAANIMIPKTRFICVRYGNVLASRGSVIPLFQDQIRNGGPVTITIPEMTRFLLSLDQAVDTVFAAVRRADPGDIYVPGAPSTTVLNIGPGPDRRHGRSRRSSPASVLGRRCTRSWCPKRKPTAVLRRAIITPSGPCCRSCVRRETFWAPALRRNSVRRMQQLNYDDTVALLKKHDLLSNPK